jgi:hypothetical protein
MSLDQPAQDVRRDPLTAARASLGQTIAMSPADSRAWSFSLFAALRKLGKVFDEHVEDSESEEGILPEMLVLKPHFEKRVRTLKQEHERIRLRIREAMAAVEEQVCSPRVDVQKLRLLAGSVVHDVRRHEARGNDLVYETLNRVDGID